MFDRRIAWIAIGGFMLAGTIISEGCSGADENASTGVTGVCGNGIKETGEACDDGNTNDSDGCRSDCTSSTCGDGEIQAANGEECDDGDNIDDNACSNSCLPNAEYCGNGTVDPGEDCDDGNTVTDDDCTNSCTTPRCGDGIVQAGEDCDDGNNELNDDCPDDCMGGGGAGGDPCTGQATYAGYVTNPTNPTQPGAGITSVWSYAGELGVKAGDEMCAAIGADHVCSYQEVLEAHALGELTTGPNALPEDQEFWIHRISMPVARLSEAGTSLPGPGGRCNDWTYPTNHISDSEFGVLTQTDPANAAAVEVTAAGQPSIFAILDDDAAYEPNLDGTANEGNGPVGGDHECPGGAQSITDATTPGCGGVCNGATPKAILCCYPVCD